MKNHLLKYITTCIILSGSAVTAHAQKQVAFIVSSDAYNWIYENILFLIGAVVILIAFGAVLFLSRNVMEAERIKMLKEQGLPVPDKLPNVSNEPNWLSNIYNRSWRVVPVEKEKDIMLDHNYDGIRELDNILPPWWVALFYGSIIFGVIYYGYHHVLDYGQSSSEAYETEVAYAEAQAKAFLARQADAVDESNVELITDEAKLGLAQTLYVNNCATCHGQAGEGGIGPNLTDQYWIHGGHINDIFKTIKYGVPEKGMIPWKSQLRPSDIQNIASYILTFQGTNPPNAKEPQGEIYEKEG